METRLKSLYICKICDKRVLEHIAIFTRKHLCWIHLLTMLQTFRPATLFKWESNANVFHWILQKFLRTYILQNVCKQQLLRKQKVNKSNLVFAKNQQKYNGKHGSVCIFFLNFPVCEMETTKKHEYNLSKIADTWKNRQKYSKSSNHVPSSLKKQ